MNKRETASYTCPPCRRQIRTMRPGITVAFADSFREQAKTITKEDDEDGND